jgi:hypothetical protein
MSYLTPIQAIRAKCLECSNDQPGEVSGCPIGDCALYPFRMGSNPRRKGIGAIHNIEKRKPPLPDAPPVEIEEEQATQVGGFVQETDPGRAVEMGPTGSASDRTDNRLMGDREETYRGFSFAS